MYRIVCGGSGNIWKGNFTFWCSKQKSVSLYVHITCSGGFCCGGWSLSFKLVVIYMFVRSEEWMEGCTLTSAGYHMDSVPVFQINFKRAYQSKDCATGVCSLKMCKLPHSNLRLYYLKCGYRYGAKKGLFTLGAYKLPSLHVCFWAHFLASSGHSWHWTRCPPGPELS